MADMRLIVAGAGGRMGRTLVKAIAETKGLVLAGALEGEGSPLHRPGRRRAGRTARQRHQAHHRRQGAAGQCRRHHRFHHSEGERGALPR